MPSSSGSSQAKGRSQVACIAGWFFIVWATREAQDPVKWICGKFALLGTPLHPVQAMSQPLPALSFGSSGIFELQPDLQLWAPPWEDSGCTTAAFWHRMSVPAKGTGFVLQGGQDKACPNGLKDLPNDYRHRVTGTHSPPHAARFLSQLCWGSSSLWGSNGRLDPRTPGNSPAGTILWADDLNSDSKVMKQWESLTSLLRSSLCCAKSL